MSKFLDEMATEAEIRLRGYQAERDILSKAAVRIAELDALIVEAQSEATSMRARAPKALGADKDELTTLGLI